MFVNNRSSDAIIPMHRSSLQCLQQPTDLKSCFVNDLAEMQDPLSEGRSPHTPTNPRGDSNMKNYCPNVVTNLTSGENYGDGVAAAAP